MTGRFSPLILSMTKTVITLLWISCLLTTTTAFSDDSSSPLSGGPTPSPELGPSEVVRIQVEALRGNDTENTGIEMTYRFASPGNKSSTGPLDRFTRMVRSAPYDRLLNHLDADYSSMEVGGNKAYQLVTVTDKLGVQTIYLWILSRQSEGRFAGCWMTDAVMMRGQQPQGLLL